MNKHTAYKTKSNSGIELLISASRNRKKCGPHFLHVTNLPPKMAREGYAVVSSRRKFVNCTRV